MKLVCKLGHSFNTTPGCPQPCLSVLLLLSCLHGTHRPSRNANIQSSQAFSEHASGPEHVCCTSHSLVCIVALPSHYSLKKFLPQSLPSCDIGSVCCLPLPPFLTLGEHGQYMSLNLSTEAHTASKATSTRGGGVTKQR